MTSYFKSILFSESPWISGGDLKGENLGGVACLESRTPPGVTFSFRPSALGMEKTKRFSGGILLPNRYYLTRETKEGFQFRGIKKTKCTSKVNFA